MKHLARFMFIILMFLIISGGYDKYNRADLSDFKVRGGVSIPYEGETPVYITIHG